MVFCFLFLLTRKNDRKQTEKKAPKCFVDSEYVFTNVNPRTGNFRTPVLVRIGAAVSFSVKDSNGKKQIALAKDLQKVDLTDQKHVEAIEKFEREEIEKMEMELALARSVASEAEQALKKAKTKSTTKKEIKQEKH